MHPAPSVILFTSLSGLGFGLLFFLGLGMPASTGLVAFVFYAIAYAFAVGGLIFSTFHLGHPERALKAFTQWRSSWLSREAWLAVMALCVSGLGAIAQIFFETRIDAISYLGAALSMATVFSTAMIYRQLATIPRWHTPWTPVLFLGYSLAGGALFAGQVSLAMPAFAFLRLYRLSHGCKGTVHWQTLGPHWQQPQVWGIAAACVRLNHPIQAQTTC